MPCMGRPARPPGTPAPLPRQPTFKFKRFGVQFQKKIAIAALSFFLLRIFFSRTKSFIDIDDNSSQFSKQQNIHKAFTVLKSYNFILIIAIF